MITNRKKLNKIAAFFFAVVLIFQLFSLNVFAADGECGDGLKWSLEGGVLTISGKGEMTNYRDGSFAPWYKNADEIRSVILPEGLENIGDLAFYGCSVLTCVSIPSSVRSIGSYAFAECTSLLRADLPEGLEDIGEAAFRGCEVLAAVRFPSTLKTISAAAFYRCAAITSVQIPSSVTNIGAQAFTYCTGLVRAVIKADINTLPKWLFYGCEKLTDVILCEGITSADEYSLQNCAVGISVYTENSDVEASNALRESITANNPDFAEKGFVADYEPPKSSSSTFDNGSAVIETQVSETENSVITVTDTSGYGDDKSDKTEISAVIGDEDGWVALTDEVNKKLESGSDSKPSVSVMTDGNLVNGDDLSGLAGKNVDLTVTTSDGTVWQVDMSKTTEDDFKGKYNLGVSLSAADPEKVKVGSDSVYSLKFAGSTGFNSTVGIRLGSSSAYQTATLYQKKTFGGYEKLQSVKVDADGRAWFNLANTDKSTDYYIGINAEGVSQDEILIPPSLSADY
ncbi:MAG: leucine-rich repeat domain-containing protein, partial [Ruminococcus sp.]|nr:leucine-rich repeat domain-containing protein [Ruminococcus sp.]